MKPRSSKISKQAARKKTKYGRWLLFYIFLLGMIASGLYIWKKKPMLFSPVSSYISTWIATHRHPHVTKKILQTINKTRALPDETASLHFEFYDTLPAAKMDYTAPAQTPNPVKPPVLSKVFSDPDALANELSKHIKAVKLSHQTKKVSTK
jgi:hypothetical protein